MINNQRPQFSLPELGSRWGEILNSALAEVITLEKEKDILAAEVARLQVAMAEMQARIEALEAEAESDSIMGLSPAAAAIAYRGPVDWGGKEKAAPVDG